jgi:hypothetical protein
MLATTDVAWSNLPSQSFELTSGIKCIDIDTQVNGVFQTDPVPDLLDNAISTDLVNLSGLDDFESAVAIIFVVRGARQRRADAGVDVCVVF